MNRFRILIKMENKNLEEKIERKINNELEAATGFLTGLIVGGVAIPFIDSIFSPEKQKPRPTSEIILNSACALIGIQLGCKYSSMQGRAYTGAGVLCGSALGQMLYQILS